jgi:DnaD/phage-associated family protein
LISIEKEAYAWAEQGIDTLEEAAAFIQKQKLMNTKLEKLKSILQIRGRSLTQAEEKYANAWLDMGFAEDALSLAYEKTCLNTGGLSWAYMNKILQRWHEAGYHTAQQVSQGDKRTPSKAASGQFGQAEMDAIAKLLRENG